ncbi:MAG: nucleotidyltransferase domain-containing protein, partial [Mariprofundaceae bacterium]
MTDNKQALQNLYEHISEKFDTGASGEVLMSGMCSGVDAILKDMWQQYAPDAAETVDLVAVGGYGRGELAPQSDWDIWFLAPEQLSAEHEEEIQAFLYALWDMNAKIGHAVRTVKQTIEHMREEWESATAAMESRLLHGSGTQYHELQAKLDGFFKKKRKAFVEAKLVEVESRHNNTGGTAFLMEPDIKEGAGGLRDVQASFWIAKAWYKSADVDDVTDLVEKGALSDIELEHLLSAQDFLWRCRAG